MDAIQLPVKSNSEPFIQSQTHLSSLDSKLNLDLPEMETFEVELVKDQQGLGITIAGYVCEKGLFFFPYQLPILLISLINN